MIFNVDSICLKTTSWLLARGLEKCYLALKVTIMETNHTLLGYLVYTTAQMRFLQCWLCLSN